MPNMHITSTAPASCVDQVSSMHSVDPDELDNIIGCYIEDLLEKEGYKQRCQDCDQINGHTQDMIRHIESATLGLLQRLRSAAQSSDSGDEKP